MCRANKTIVVKHDILVLGSNRSSKVRFVSLLRILTGKKTPKWNFSANEQYEYRHLGCWYIKSTLYKRFLNWNKIFKRIKQQLAKLLSLWKVHFVFTILFVLTLVSEIAVLNENNAFSILALSSKKQYSSFLKKFSFSREFVSKLVLKTFEISIDFQIKTCRSLKRRTILKFPSMLF